MSDINPKFSLKVYQPDVNQWVDAIPAATGEIMGTVFLSDMGAGIENECNVFDAWEDAGSSVATTPVGVQAAIKQMAPHKESADGYYIVDAPGLQLADNAKIQLTDGEAFSSVDDLKNLIGLGDGLITIGTENPNNGEGVGKPYRYYIQV